MFAAIGLGATSCVPNPEGGVDGKGTPVIEILGEATVNNAVSVDIPIKAENLSKLAFMVEEYIVLENGEEWTVKSYDANKKPVLGRLVSKDPAIHLIFNAQNSNPKKGKTIENVTSLDILHISGNEGLDKNKKFVVYIAGIDYNKSYYNNKQILSVKFETPEKYSDSDVTVLRESFEGMDVAVTFPEDVRKRGNCIRWGVTNVATRAYNGNPPTAEALYLCDFVYPASIIHRDTVLNINHHNAYRRNAQGEIGYYIIGANGVTEADPYDESITSEVSPIQYYYLFQPGEPLVLILGEAAYCSKDTGLSPNMGWSYGNETGWYWFPFDLNAYISALSKGGVDPEQFWYSEQNGYPYTAWHKIINLTLPGPGKFDGNVSVITSNITTKGGTISLYPDDKTYMYLVGLYEDTDQYGGGFKDITRTYLNNDESLWQWFTTAEMAPNFGISFFFASEGPQEIKLENYFTSLTAGGTYHLVVNALGSYIDDRGDLQADTTLQNFQHIEFKLQDYTLPEPELIVTACEPYSPWKVKFNVKNPDYATNPVEMVAFAANYTREWGSYMNYYGYTYTDMVMMNAGLSYYQLSSKDVELVNSEIGADIEFDVLENSDFRVAFMAWNKEGRASNPDKEGSQAVADGKSGSLEPVERVEGMTQLEALAGDWTASAKIMAYDATTGIHTEKIHSWKVTIGDLDANKTLTEADYALFEQNGVTREQTDAYLAEYNKQAAAYNAKVAGQNRVLCQGWQLDNERTLSTAQPWDLFLMKDYNASIVDYLFIDFGPKWFLQVDEQGDIFLPVNYNRIPSLTSWFNGNAHYLVGGNYETGYAFYYNPEKGKEEDVKGAGLPVVIGTYEGKEAIAINGYYVPFEDEEGNVTNMSFYPNVMYDYYGQLSFYNTYVISNVILTRGWEETTPDQPAVAPLKSSAKVAGSKAVESANGATYTTPKRVYAKSIFTAPTTKKVEVKKANLKQMTPEQTKAGMEKLTKRMCLGFQK